MMKWLCSGVLQFSFLNVRMKQRRIFLKDEKRCSLLTEEGKQNDDPHPKRTSLWHTRRFEAAFFIGLLISTIVLFLSCSNRNLWLWDFRSTKSSVSRRFPKYGSADFAQQCNWTTRHSSQDCTFVVRPSPDGYEGIAQWIAEVVSAHILAKQTRCRLLFDYGDAVDIHQVLKPLSMNWTIPYGFQCSHRCVTMSNKELAKLILSPRRFVSEIGTTIGRKAIVVPYYRRSQAHTDSSDFQELRQELPNFDLKTGMACSLGSLFDLAPSAAQFERELFTRILPTLRDEKALTMTIYYRSGYTDEVALAEKKGQIAKESVGQYIEGAMPCIHCALDLERKYLSITGMSFSHVVWMVVTDSPHLKQWIRGSYSSQQQQDANNGRVSVDRQKLNLPVPREIVTTSARGTHTRTSRNPSTADFAQALIDWYLIGESDLVISNSGEFTFGWTAALRTMRPFYLPNNCSNISIAPAFK